MICMPCIIISPRIYAERHVNVVNMRTRVHIYVWEVQAVQDTKERRLFVFERCDLLTLGAGLGPHRPRYRYRPMGSP